MQHDKALISDQVRRFMFEERPVRGHWVHLEGAWRELRAHASYPQPVSELLGQAVAAVVLLAATLKFRGMLTFQLQGDGAVSLLLAQCTHDFRLRAVARFDVAAIAALPTEPDRATLFRRLVGGEGRVTVAADAESAAGMLVQKLPGPSEDEDEAAAAAWQDAKSGIAQTSGRELLATP